MQALLVAKWPVELQYHTKSCILQMAQLLPEAATSSDGAPYAAFQEKAALQGQPLEAAFCGEGVPSASEGDAAKRLPYRWIRCAARWPWPGSKACWAMLCINTPVDVYR